MRFIIILLLLIPQLTFAGGDNWEFRIESIVDKGQDSIVLILRPNDIGGTRPLNCNSLTVNVEYSAIRWLFFGGKEINRDNHIQAIIRLKEAKSNDIPIRFGRMGEGFGFESANAMCVVKSRALSIVKENDGKEAIYSYYKWP